MTIALPGPWRDKTGVTVYLAVLIWDSDVQVDPRTAQQHLLDLRRQCSVAADRHVRRVGLRVTLRLAACRREDWSLTDACPSAMPWLARASRSCGNACSTAARTEAWAAWNCAWVVPSFRLRLMDSGPNLGRMQAGPPAAHRA
jgi:hypothetical protein